MFFEILLEQLKRAERLSLTPYEDSQGYLTIGYGHLVEKGISGEIAYRILKADIIEAIADLNENKPWWNDLPLQARLVVADMCFNLGWPKYAKFIRFWAALERRDYNTAAEEMRDSLWYGQVKTRGVRLALMMESCI